MQVNVGPDATTKEAIRQKRIREKAEQAIATNRRQQRQLDLLAEACTLLFKGVRGTATQADLDRIQAISLEWGEIALIQQKAEDAIATGKKPEEIIW